jgi:glycopeptide antibiotics resistance protein
MKALIVLTVLLTLAVILLQYRREKNFTHTLIALLSFGIVISFAVAGNVTRPIIPLYLAHFVLVIMAWGGVLYYLFRRRFLWWLILSPAVTIILFVALSLLEGSRYEDVWGSLL